MSKPVVLCILDGWGLRDDPAANAPRLAKTPHFDAIMAGHPSGQLVAHGPDVGLPEGQMGNSEVGHMNIGAGRVVWMDLPKINNAIADGSFGANTVLTQTLGKVSGVVHIAGLVSDGGVHAHTDHIIALAQAADAAGVTRCWPNHSADASCDTRGRFACECVYRHGLWPLLCDGSGQALGPG